MTQSPSEFILSAARQYSMYVCTERAIPSVTDGFKSVQRIATWVLSKRSGKIKVAALSGAMVESNLYVHGDAQGAISGMAGPIVNNVPVFKGTGLFGSLVTPKGFGAGRYTYVEKSDFMERVILADSNLYKMVPSIDGDNEMCETFLPLIPTVLLNGISGMAIGWSTDIMPHKYEDLRDAVIRVLNGKPVGKIKPFYNAYPEVEIEEVDNGRDNSSKYTFTGKFRRLNSNTLQIYAIPPETSIEKLQEHLDLLVENKKIADYTNNTTNVIDITVKMFRNDMKSMTDDQIVRLLKIQTSATERLVCVDFNGETIRVFKDVEELITEWVKWRFQFIVKRFDVMIYETDEELNFQRALKKMFDDDFVKKIPSFKSRDEMRKKIQSMVQEEFDLRPSRIEQILGFAAYRWTQEYREENIKKIAELQKELVRLNEIRSSDANMKDEWISDLKKVKF